MESLSITWQTPIKRPAEKICQDACLVHIYPTGLAMGSRYVLNPDGPLILGRDPDCDIILDDKSVSRRHARVQPGIDGYYVVDLQSTNGTFVNDVPAAMTRLQDGDQVRVGNCIYRYLASGNVEAQYHEEIYRLTIVDALTEIYNKRYLTEYLDRELLRSARHNRPLAMVLLDIDHFKTINDRFSHLAGDFTLHELASFLIANLRGDELFARFGGEEFAIVLVETSLPEAVGMAERIRTLVENHEFAYEGKTYRVTISLGVAGTMGEIGLTSRDLIQQVDAKLYEAKRAGRNCVRA